MTAEELVNRLESDLESSIKTQNSVGSVESQIRNFAGDVKNFVGALNAIPFKTHLKNVIQLINSAGPILTYNGPETVTSEETLNEVNEKRDEIIERVQFYIDSPNVISVIDNETIAKTLEDELDNLHSVSGSYLM